MTCPDSALYRHRHLATNGTTVMMQEVIAVTDETHDLRLTPEAAQAASKLLEREGRRDLRLRVSVQPGGCSGLVYQLYFDERLLEGDAVMDHDGLEVVVDRMSRPYLAGATVSYSESIEKMGFTLDNPNAEGSCACGDSFH